jgi:alpha-1,6-mannosyltransferase
MPFTLPSLPRLLFLSGFTYFAAIFVVVLSMAPLGSTLFLAAAAVAAACYAVMLWRVWNEPVRSRRLLHIAFAFAVLFRAPLALAPVGPDSDMVRYLWDGRVQLHGYNPYAVIPADPALAHTHTEQTAAMPSLRHKTPYPPAAQLFFRLVVAVWDSTLAMKLALVGGDLLTLIVLWRWLAITGRSEWLALAYAWNPLVILEVAHSGHIDALVALWTVASAYWLTRRRTTLASIAFVLAIATKVLPIVLAPLFIGRIRWRDALIAISLLSLLYLPFAWGRELPFGSVPGVMYLRFNGPVFQAVASLVRSPGAAVFAVLAGTAAALWVRRRLAADDPAAWAWPMAIALLAAPVIYPWYLLPLTPFLGTRAALPITVWTIAPVYVVWGLVREGGRWIVPTPLLALEYGLLVAACAVVILWYRQQQQPRDRGQISLS